MSLMQFLFGDMRKAAKSGGKPPNSQPFGGTQFAASQNSKNPGGAQADHRELLRIVLRETLSKNGIPMPWIGADALAATAANRAPGIHVRLLIKQWDPRLPQFAMAFQQDFERRLITLDPLAPTWLMGISWQYALPNNDVCPRLPHPDSWLEEPVAAAAQPVAAAPSRRPAAAAVILATGGSADVIEGPVRIATRNKTGDASADARADLEALLAIRDADMRNNASLHGTFANTEPMGM